jgi:sugar (pentulose or hexulose) kinase
LPAYIGVDLGTSGCRAVAIDQAGTELAQTTSPLALPRRVPEGGSEQEPELWWSAVLRVLRRLSGQLAGYRPLAMAIDGTSATLLIADGHGQPLGPALMYDDQRHRAERARIAAVAPPDSPVHSASSSLAKLLGLAKGVNLKTGAFALHQADWITGRLTGRLGVSDENNCLKLGYDPFARRWPDWMGDRRLGLPLQCLPHVVPAGTLLGPILPELAKQTGLPPGLQIVAGTTDSTAAALAAGISEPGDGVTALGSTLVLKVLSSTPVTAAEYGVYSHRLEDRWLVGGASNSGGAVLESFFSRAKMQAMTRQLTPEQPTGLDYYPLARPGERFPFNDPSKPVRLTPLPSDPVQFFQGLLEGIAEIERLGYERLRTLGAPAPRRVLTIGGGSRNPAWRRIRQARLGLPVIDADHQQAAYGSALLARRNCSQLLQ